jgi:hypothetical protein
MTCILKLINLPDTNACALNLRAKIKVKAGERAKLTTSMSDCPVLIVRVH